MRETEGDEDMRMNQNSQHANSKHTCNKCSFNIINEYRTRIIWQQREQAEQPRQNGNAREARTKKTKKKNNNIRRDSAILRETKQKRQQQRKRMKRRVENY